MPGLGIPAARRRPRGIEHFLEMPFLDRFVSEPADAPSRLYDIRYVHDEISLLTFSPLSASLITSSAVPSGSPMTRLKHLILFSKGANLKSRNPGSSTGPIEYFNNS